MSDEILKPRVAVELKCLQPLCTFSHLAGNIDRFSLIRFLVSRNLPLLLCLGFCMLSHYKFYAFLPRGTFLDIKESLRLDSLFVCLGFFYIVSYNIGDNVGDLLQLHQVNHERVLGNNAPDLMFFAHVVHYF